MRYMLIVKANEDTEAGIPPTQELLNDMTSFNEEMVKAGILLAGDGLQASSKGARVHFTGAGRRVVDGPFAETKELVAGFWIIQVKSLEEAIEWVKRAPNPTGAESVIEIRELFESADFPEGEWSEKEAQLRQQLAGS
ncbi:MAG: YciI family protein [Actinomycetota bacterium]